MKKICEMCGKSFESINGQKYCSDQCRNVAIKINKLRYQAKHLERRKVTANDLQQEMERLQQETQQQQKVAFNTSGAIVGLQELKENHSYTTNYLKDRNNLKKVGQAVQFVSDNQHIDYITKSLEACKELDNAHNKVQAIIDVLKIEQAKYNKEDFDFSHTVEGSAYLTDQQKLDIWNDYQKSRSKRRNVKDVIRVLISLVKYIPNNSEQLLKDAIQGKIQLDEFYNDFYKSRNGGNK